MSKGGARLGAGRKPKEEALKVANFRLSMEDLKILDKKGIGKNSSERLRYILQKFKSEKLNISKRRKAYKIEKFTSFEEANLKFETLTEHWKTLDKNGFLLKSNFKSDICMKYKMKFKKNLDNFEEYDELKKFDWFLHSIEFQWIESDISRVDIYLKKGDYLVTLPITKEEDEFIIKYKDEIIEETVDEIGPISLYEEEMLSYLYEKFQELLFKKKYIINSNESLYCKKYSNGDIYKTLEFDNIVIIEFEYKVESEIATLNSIKNLV